MIRADDLIAKLDLAPHPEGGHFRETFRDHAAGGRAHSTAIYYLLKAGEVSRRHRIDAAEVWHWYTGAPLRLSVSDGNGETTAHLLGNDIPTGHRPQLVVPAHTWQSAESLGDFTLVGCTVAPGFEFSALEFAEGNSPPP